MTKKYEVACVGILCADVLAKPVDMMPEKGKLALIEKLQLRIGGCAANVSVDLSKIGIDTAIIGKIGVDGFGRFILDTLKAEKVDVAGLSKGWDIEKCATFANAVGTHCVMEIGTTTGIKSMSETLEFMSIYEKRTMKQS